MTDNNKLKQRAINTQGLNMKQGNQRLWQQTQTQEKPQG